MGNTCVGPRITNNSFFQSVSATLWRARAPDDDGNALPPPTPDCGGATKDEPHVPKAEPAPLLVQNRAPEPVKMAEESPPAKPPEPPPAPAAADPPPPRPPRKPHQVKRVASAGLRTDSVLRRKTENIKDVYSFGRKLGQGQFGLTYLCVEKATGKEFACKSIAKRKLLTEEDVEDVRREIQIMHHLAGHPNVISIVGAYEDDVAVHVVMALCAGGELFDRITQRGHYMDRKAAELARVIVGVVEACHSLGVMHRDLQPENFLFINQQEESPFKTIDFGLSIFFCPGIKISNLELVDARGYNRSQIASNVIESYLIQEYTAAVISTMLPVSGITTALNSYFGTRLPLVQGSSFVYLAPTLVIANSEEFCNLSGNKFKHIMRELQGAIIVGSLFQTILGYSGLMSLLLRGV